MKLFWKSLFLIGGLVLFGWYVSGIGLKSVWQAILSLGSWAPLVLVPYLVVYVVDCLAWSQTLPVKSTRLRFLTLLRIRWSGESLNNLVPSAYVGGEALKVYLLRSYGINATEGATSSVISKSAQTLGQLAFILVASVIFLIIASSHPGLRVGLAFICIAGCAAVIALFWVQRLGLFRMIIALFEKLRLKFHPLEVRKAKLLELDATILGFYRREPRRFYASTLLYLGGWMLDTVEIYLVAHLLDMPITWSQAVVMEAFTGVAKALGMWLPGSLGIQESGIILMGRLTGLPDTLAAAYALIRRARELIFVAIGMLLLYTGPSSPKTESIATAH